MRARIRRTGKLSAALYPTKANFTLSPAAAEIARAWLPRVGKEPRRARTQLRRGRRVNKAAASGCTDSPAFPARPLLQPLLPFFAAAPAVPTLRAFPSRSAGAYAADRRARGSSADDGKREARASSSGAEAPVGCELCSPYRSNELGAVRVCYLEAYRAKTCELWSAV